MVVGMQPAESFIEGNASWVEGVVLGAIGGVPLLLVARLINRQVVVFCGFDRRCQFAIPLSVWSASKSPAH